MVGTEPLLASRMNSFYSILNFESDDGCHVPNSPRTLEACLRSGFAPDELLPNQVSDYKAPGVPLAVAKSKCENNDFASRRLMPVPIK